MCLEYSWTKINFSISYHLIRTDRWVQSQEQALSHGVWSQKTEKEIRKRETGKGKGRERRMEREEGGRDRRRRKRDQHPTRPASPSNFSLLVPPHCAYQDTSFQETPFYLSPVSPVLTALLNQRLWTPQSLKAKQRSWSDSTAIRLHAAFALHVANPGRTGDRCPTSHKALRACQE